MQGFKTSICFCDAIICARAHCMCHPCEETDHHAVWHELTSALACLHSVVSGLPVLGGYGGLTLLFQRVTRRERERERSRALLQATKPEIHSLAGPPTQ